MIETPARQCVSAARSFTTFHEDGVDGFTLPTDFFRL
jgi:hypothetical protein